MEWMDGDELGLCWVECGRCGASTVFCAQPELAIDAWNTRAERTCHLSKVTSWDDDGHNTWGVICSACDAHIEHDTGYGIRYCPKCGARVVK